MKEPLPIYSTKFFGHNKVIDFFTHAVQKNKISRAYLFFGPKGIGKETFAIHLSRFLIDPNSEKLGTTDEYNKLYISMCNKTLDNFLYIKKDTILIDDIKNINDFIHKKTVKTKIIIIDNIENISIQASNAMLKSLEDIENVIFLIITSDETRVLSTIKSRCIKIPFHHLDKDISTSTIRTVTSNEINETILKISNYSPGIYIDLVNLKFDSIYENISNNIFSESISIDILQKNNIYYTVLIIQSILMILSKKDISIIPKKFHSKLDSVQIKSVIDTYFTVLNIYANFINYKLDSEMTLYEIYSCIRKLFE